MTSAPPVHKATSQDLSAPKPVRWITVLSVAIVLMALNTGWIANSEMRTSVTEITISTLFIGVTFILFLLTLLNQLLRRLGGGRWALNQAELMLIYSMLSLSSVVAGVGHMGFFTPFLTNPFYYATSANNWKSLWSLLPSYIGPRDPAILKGFYAGQSTFFQLPVMRAWAMPLLVWSAFFLTLLWMTLCIAAIVRRRWAEQEHLRFPVVALPLEMTREDAAFYRSPLLWIGFSIPCFLHSLNTLHTIFPTVPSWPINSARDLTAGLGPPLNALSPMFGGIHPCGVGFGYLINTDVLFSVWVFYLFRKALNLLGVFLGWRDVGVGQFADGGDQFPFTPFQSWGAWTALSLAVLWQGRDYFAGYLRRALKNDSEDEDEPMSARTAMLGFLGGFLLICIFVWSSGGSWWIPPVFLGLYVLLMVVLARLEGETAVLSPFLVWVDPQSILTGLAGTANLSRMDAIHVGMLSWFNSDYRAAALPHQLQGFVGQKRAGGTFHRLAAMLMLAAAISLAFALLWDLQMYYTNGAATANVNAWRIFEGSKPWNDVQHYLQHPIGPNVTAWGAAAAGAAITGLLALLRNRFVGFPLAPAAYVLNTSWANDLFWLDMLLAWILKVMVLRYGGGRGYARAMPFFLGLILGDFVTGSFWSIVSVILHLDLFRTFST